MIHRMPKFILETTSVPEGWHRVAVDSMWIREICGRPLWEAFRGMLLAYTAECPRDLVVRGVSEQIDRFEPGSVTVYLGQHQVAADFYFRNASDAVLFKLGK